MIWMLFFVPVISTFIGWFAGFIIIKLLFHPQKPVKFSGITFQGFFPNRRQQIAKKFGKLISNELLSFKEIEEVIANPANIEKILPLLETHIDIFLREKLAAEIPMIGMLIGEKTILQVKGVFMKELKEILPGLIQQYIVTLLGDLDVEKIIIEKAEKFSLDETENALSRMLSDEFRLVKTLGAVAGFLTGLIQVFLTIALK